MHHILLHDHFNIFRGRPRVDRGDVPLAVEKRLAAVVAGDQIVIERLVHGVGGVLSLGGVFVGIRICAEKIGEPGDREAVDPVGQFGLFALF